MRNFTTEDFSGCGQYLVRNDKEPNQYVDTGFLTTVMKKVGWCPGQGTQKWERTYTLTDMSDGLTKLGYFDQRRDPGYKSNPRECNTSLWDWVQFTDLMVLCDYLNNPDLCHQEYRFATQEEVVRVVMFQSSRWK